MRRIHIGEPPFFVTEKCGRYENAVSRTANAVETIAKEN